MTEQKANLEVEVKNWLESQGYPLEMKVASEFQKSGFDIQQSFYYMDPDTNKFREIDVIATKGLYTGKVFAHIRFIIECKTSKRKPWVVFTRKNKIIDYEYYDWYCTSKMGWDYVLHASIEGLFDGIETTFHKRATIGYGITQAFTTGEDITYKALNTVRNCAIAYAKCANNHKLDMVEIIVPVVVFEGELFEAHLDKNEVLTKRVDESVVLWHSALGNETGIGIHILTYKHLPTFAKLAGLSAERICDDWKNNLETILSEMHHNRSELSIEG